MQLFDDGRVAYDGERDVSVRGERVRYVARDEARTLILAFEGVAFWGWEASCSLDLTDMTTAVVALSAGARWKAVCDCPS